MEDKHNPQQRRKDNKRSDNFLLRYKWWFIICLLLAFIGFIVIYFSFCGYGFIPTGNELSKSDWLLFLSGYLSFAGTVAVALIATLQSHYYNEQENKRRYSERKKKIQPIFSVKIVGIDNSLNSAVEIFSQHDPSTLLKHKNVRISIKNVNSYPITHVIIFDKYISPLLESGETIDLYCAYWDSIDAERWPDKVLVLTDDIERGEKGCPSWFNIMYEDIDGASMYQAFVLKNFDGVLHYSLDYMEDIS